MKTTADSAMKNWFIIKCTSGQEGRAERYLERMGYPHGWHPERKVRLSEAVYQRLLTSWRKLGNAATSRKPDRYRKKPYVYGYVFLPADSIEIYKINGHHPRVWMEVLCVEGEPYRLTDADMARMRDVPSVIAELVADAERARREAWEAKRPKIGGKAQIVGGLFEGQIGQVTALKDGEAEIDIGALVGRVKINEEMLEAVA